MAKILIKLFDYEIDFEEYLLVYEKDVDQILELLDEYRDTHSEYGIEGFIDVLDKQGIRYEWPTVKYVYF